MNPIQNSSKLIMLILVVMVCALGCKSKKKAMEAAAAEKARMEQEAQLKRQQEEAELKRKAAEESARREAEAREREAAAARAATPAKKLGQYFDAISQAGSVNAANSSINEALSLFASPETPVLIVISEDGGQKDYDRPTTIRDYLNYLKDQKKRADAISDLKFDNAGKITEVELKK